MRPLHHLILATCISEATWATLPTDVHCQPASLWDHNSSVMALYGDGASRILGYHEPRIAMQQEGVASSTLLFSGNKSGNTYAGSPARTLSIGHSCQRQPPRTAPSLTQIAYQLIALAVPGL